MMGHQTNYHETKKKGDRQIMLELLGRFGVLYWGGVIRLCPFSIIDPAVLHGFGRCLVKRVKSAVDSCFVFCQSGPMPRPLRIEELRSPA